MTIEEGIVKLTETDPDFQDDDHILNPSDYAVTKAFKLLESIRLLSGQDIPKGYATLESRGGIYITWESEEFGKEIMVQIEAEESIEGSVFCCDDIRGEDYLIKNPSPSQVSELLAWIKTGQSIEEMLTKTENSNPEYRAIIEGAVSQALSEEQRPAVTSKEMNQWLDQVLAESV